MRGTAHHVSACGRGVARAMGARRTGWRRESSARAARKASASPAADARCTRHRREERGTDAVASAWSV